jgi:putative nucleotidyltransferase with HDIG domain
MSTGGRKKIRTGRVAPLELPPGRIAQAWNSLRSSSSLVRFGFAVLAALAMWLISGAWAEPFPYHLGTVPDRNITAKIAFKRPDARALEEARKLAEKQEPVVYRQDPKELILLRAALQHVVTEIVNANSFADVNPDTWKQFQAAPDGKASVPTEGQEEPFEKFRAGIGGQPGLVSFELAVAKAFEPVEQHGLLEKLPEQHGEANQKEIAVYPVGKPHEKYLVQVSDILIGGAENLHKRLEESLPQAVAEPVFAWLHPRLRSTLILDDEATTLAREAAKAAVPDQFIFYEAGQPLAVAAKPLDEHEMRLLKAEHEAFVHQLPFSRKLDRSVAVFGMFAALFGLCGYYVYHRQPALITENYRLTTLLTSAIVTVGLIEWTSPDPWRAGLIPLLLFGMTFAIAYHRDVAIVLSMALSIAVVVLCGAGLGEFIIWMAVVASAIVQLGRIRSRSKLIKVGALSGIVAFSTTVGVGLLENQPWDWPLLNYAARNGLWTLAAGFLLTGLLPIVENMFGVLTEISLLEWGDVSHPLLQELVRRAPGTYNHSINVASIAEAAAESIGARGLLVRVGAYFHDIGKMLKPGYFVENQTPGANRHDGLMPAMSTLIIIAHIKDGADLARQHDLPEPILDFIEQHHGTTLVEFFYRRANQQSEADPNGVDVPESSYRYPGPKPQTIEAAVLMMADAVESASRALVEPTPARIENLVEEICMKKLLDGQFDECGLTLEQLRTVEDSLVKSLTAVYHGRIKYPDQRTA